MGALTHRRYRSTQPVKLNNSAGNEFISTPDPMTTLQSGAFVIETRLMFSDWTPAADRIFIQHGNVDGNLGWEAALLTTGQIRLSYFPTGLLAGRISQSFTPPFTLENNVRYGLRLSYLRDFLGVASAYLCDFQYPGGRWVNPPIQSAALSASFNCTGDLLIGADTGLTDVYSYKMWFGNFGVGQLVSGRYHAPDLDASISLQVPGATSWTSASGHIWTVDGSNVERSKFTYPAAA